MTTVPKTIDTLVSDIYSVLDGDTDHIVNEENLEQFAHNLKDLIRTKLRKPEGERTPLRFSALGKPDRQLWYQAKGYEGEKLIPKTYLKFLYGDIIEQLLVLLAKEAGHQVTHEQEEVEIAGVKGHIDCLIDGVLVDVKSASPYSYQKFENEELLTNPKADSFGYIKQLSGYANVLTPGKEPYFLANDKVGGDICLLKIPIEQVNRNKPEPQIEHQKKVIASDTIPERCFQDEEDGKSGNRKLGTNCSYCAFKTECWPELRTYLYSNGPRFLTKVIREPNVFEKT